MLSRTGYVLGVTLFLAGAALMLYGVFRAPEAPVFFGEMWLPRGVPSRLIVRPLSPRTPDPATSPFEVTELAGVDLEGLFPERPPRLGDSQQAYETVNLPFSVTLRALEYEAGETTLARLDISTGTQTRQIAFSEGAPVIVEEESFVMRETRTWGGILSEPRESGGTPLAVVALRREGGNWAEDIVAQHGDWLRFGEDVAFRFLWVESGSHARQSLAAGLPGLESARWGVEEDGAMNWFDSFLVGTGLELSDGTTVVLAEVRDNGASTSQDGAAVRFTTVRDGDVRNVWVAANGVSEDGLLHFSYPTLAPFVFLACSWEPDAMVFQLYVNGEESGGGRLERGQFAAFEEVGLEFRLDQVLESAVYLRRQDSPLEELVLEGGGKVLRIRQGEAVLIGECAVEFFPASTEMTPVYTLEIEGPGAEKTITLHGEDAFLAGGWTIQQAAGGGISESWAALYLEYIPKPPAIRWGAYVLLAGAALAAVTAFFRSAGRKRRKQLHAGAAF